MRSQISFGSLRPVCALTWRTSTWIPSSALSSANTGAPLEARKAGRESLGRGTRRPPGAGLSTALGTARSIQPSAFTLSLWNSTTSPAPA